MNLPQTATDTPVKQRLTAKQRKWIKIYSQTLNATEAAMQVYNCKDRNVAKSIGNENLTKLDYNGLMETIGLTDEIALIGMRKGIDSTRPVIDPKTGDLKAVPDYLTRFKYLEAILKMRGRLQDTSKVELTGKDGEPVKFEAMVGIGFMNKPDDPK